MATRTIALAAALAAALATPALADEVRPDTAPGITDPTPPPVPPAAKLPPKWQVDVHGALRVTVLDAHGDRFAADAMEYGWRSAEAVPLTGVTVDVSYLWTPIVDLGASAGWMRGTFAAAVDDTDRLRVRNVGLGVSARLHWMRGRPFVPEPRVDAGVIRERLEVHGVLDTTTVTYLRAGIDWRLGTATGGVTLAVGYTMADRNAEAAVSPPIGGLDLAAGPYFRF